MNEAPDGIGSFTLSDRPANASPDGAQKLAAAGGIIGALAASSCCILFIATGFWLVYRGSKVACADRETCAHPLSNRLVKITLIAATVIVLAAWAFDYVAPYLLS